MGIKRPPAIPLYELQGAALEDIATATVAKHYLTSPI